MLPAFFDDALDEALVLLDVGEGVEVEFARLAAVSDDFLAIGIFIIENGVLGKRECLGFLDGL